jgi:hypothetical protein
VEYGNFHSYDCTTDPGTHWVENIMRKDGVAILKPGQYRGSHIIRKHQGRYDALGQDRPVSVYRDDNRDHGIIFMKNLYKLVYLELIFIELLNMLTRNLHK